MKTSTKGVCFTVAGGVCWGMSGILGKMLFDDFGLTATWLVNLRMIASGIIMLFISYIRTGKDIFQVWKRKDSRISQLIFSVIGMATCQMSYFLAIQYSNPGTATVLQYTSPAIIMLFYLLIEKRKPNKVEILVLLSVVVGVFLLSTRGDIGNLAMTKQALFWGIMASVSLVIYNIQPAKIIKEFGSFNVVGWAMMIGGIVVSPAVPVWKVPGTWNGQTFLLSILVIVIGTIIPFSAYLQGVVMLGAVKASMFACIEPLVATVLTAIILKEAFVGMDVIGMACIVIGVSALAIFDKDEEEGIYDQEGIGIGSH